MITVQKPNSRQRNSTFETASLFTNKILEVHYQVSIWHKALMPNQQLIVKMHLILKSSFREEVQKAKVSQ